jgi:SAM-dependent methyltransferase
MAIETHEIVIIKPKPSSDEIERMTSRYFDAKSREYDQFENVTLKRDLFTEKVDQLIAAEYKNNPKVNNILSIACGTGRREKEIEKLTGRTLNFTGVEISPEMLKLASARGLKVKKGAWLQIPSLDRTFDSAILLSAFGHVPTSEDREKFLTKIAEHLSPGASLFLDVLNIDDQFEWGPKIDTLFSKENLGSYSFDRGDVFYRKIGEPEVCFYHYFSTGEIKSLLQKSEFTSKNLWYVGYGASFGEIKTSAAEGAIFIEGIRN